MYKLMVRVVDFMDKNNIDIYLNIYLSLKIYASF